MLRSKISKEDIHILHWSCIGIRFKSYYVLKNEFYEIKYNLQTTDFLWGYQIDNNYEVDEGFSMEHIYRIIIQNTYNSSKLTLDELLQNEDKIMLSTDQFRENIQPYIRNQKINNIINGN